MYTDLFTQDIYGAAAVSLAVAVLVMGVLYYEARLPLFISVLFVPPIVAAGFGLAVYLHVEFSMAMLQSAGVLAGLIVPAALLYQLVVDPV